VGLDGEVTKLKDADIDSCHFVMAGAQPDAKILLYKSKDGKPMKTEGGVEYPAEAFAYVPEPDKPSTWKLRLWDETHKVTPHQVGMAIAALGSGGFRGNKVQLPSDAIAGVKAKIKTAWHKANPDKKEEDMPEIITKDIKQSLLNKIIHIFKSDDSEEYTDEELEKGMEDHIEACKENELNEELHNKNSILSKGGNKTMAESKDKKNKLEEDIEEEKDGKEDGKMDEEDMKEGEKKMGKDGVKKENLPADVKAYIENLENKVNKSAETEVIVKSLQESIAKMKDEQLTKEYIEKAKSFNYLGINASELGSVMKSIAISNPEAVSKIEAVLKAANEAVREGGLYEELGSNSEGSSTSAEAWAQIETLAEQQVAKDINISKAQAIDMILKTEKGQELYNIYTSGI